MFILESTVPPGTSENLVIPILRKNMKKYFYYAHCPERAIPGKTLTEMVFNDRIIGGLDVKSAKLTQHLYSSFVKGTIYITNTKTAEFVKLMENTFRDINIALANEFALMAEEFEIDVWKAIEMANRHPRVDILKPGPGVGGHCIAVDPLFLAEKSSRSRIVSLAREINDSMPAYVIKVVKDILKDIENPTITLLGLAYKGNVDDTRESPSFKIKKIAESEGMTVKLYDPLIRNFPGNLHTINEAVQDADCIVLVTDHDIFKTIDPKSLPVRKKNLIDTRNILNHPLWRDAGYHVRILGVGSLSEILT
ncbi:UDP-N-acetyl-D-mannosamine dehydrogenase [uncultured archaeon]|nr:UDP-N-acetyl-D-mannosamine dehydrogenase [uncultured archaeon]